MKRRKSRKTLRNSSRRQRHNIPDLVDPNLVDSISPLPDSILGIILSFLPTKNAVATAILSKRWKSVWMTVHNLDFCHELEDDEYEDIKFIRFVNRVMLLHDAGLLYKFRLVWNSLFISPLATSWINTAITRNVHELFLSVWDSDEQPFEMPISVFSCGSLRSLELCGVIIVSAANVVFLPRLESLKLVNVEFQTKEEFEKLICGCPMLTCIHLHVDPEEPPYNVGNFEGFMYIISSISLRRLELQFGYECSLKLEASSLEYFKLHGYISEIYVQKSLSSLVEADFSINLDGHDFSYNSIVEAIRAFDYAKALTLSCDAMEALNSATISLSTDFKRLMKLETESYACDCIPLQDFIQSSHNLEVFTNSQQSYDEDLDHSMWTIPAEVPRCLSNSLKKVVFDGYNGLYNEREMIRYILNHGSVLEVMKISCARGIVDGAKLELVQEICNFPKKSPACEVEFF